MNVGPRAARAFWNTYWDVLAHYHRFEVRGIERLDGIGKCLFVGYHGRAVAHDMILLGRRLEASGGVAPKAIMHKSMRKLPVLKWFVEGLEYPTEDGEEVRQIFEQGGALMVTPGGSLEGCRSFRERYRVRWGERYGYLRLALKYKLPIVPTAGTGVDDTYIGLNDGYAWGKRLGLPMGITAWAAFGLGGPWPFTLPFPVKIVCHIGDPIDLERDGPVDPNDREALGRLHARVAGTVQALLDGARGVAAPAARASA